MKLLLTALLAGTAAAFAPAHMGRAATTLSMSSDVPLLEIKAKVPCFGATPLGGEPVFIGENYWDKLTTDYGSEATGSFIRAAELKHGRSAMLAICATNLRYKLSVQLGMVENLCTYDDSTLACARLIPNSRAQHFVCLVAASRSSKSP